MKTKLASLVRKLNETDQNRPTPPENWEDGFKNPRKPKDEQLDTPLRLMRGEVPFFMYDSWYLFVWDEQDNDIVVYKFSTDLTIPYQEFHSNLQNRRKSTLPRPSASGLFEAIAWNR